MLPTIKIHLVCIDFSFTDFPPVIVQHPYNQMVEFHFDLYLRCRAVGANLKYQWTHNDSVLVPNSHYSIINESDIVINNVQSSDAGQYQCIVSNSSGKVASKYATILVVGRGELQGMCVLLTSFLNKQFLLLISSLIQLIQVLLLHSVLCSHVPLVHLVT